jgi:U3 small nucleolar RNA-associated protein 7
MGIGRTVQILKDAYSKPAEALYMTHKVRTPDAKLAGGGGATARAQCLASAVLVSDVTFRPLEDSLCIGHSHGVSSIIVPGAGEANFDSFEANPFISQKQRREEEVQSLLGKLSPDMIGLGINILEITCMLSLWGNDQEMI